MSVPVRDRRGAAEGRLLSLLCAVGILAAWWLYLAPASIGGPASYVVIRGDSMLPVLEGGDLVIVMAADRYAVGDVVAYRVPAGELGEGSVVIHRIVAGDSSGGWVVEGDNNPAPDPWRPRSPDLVGTAWLRVPLLGRAISVVLQPAVAGALAAAVVAGILALRWTPRRVDGLIGG